MRTATTFTTFAKRTQCVAGACAFAQRVGGMSSFNPAGFDLPVAIIGMNQGWLKGTPT